MGIIGSDFVGRLGRATHCVLCACRHSVIAMTKTKKPAIDEAAARLALIAERALARLSEEEQDARVEGFSKRKFSSVCETTVDN